MSWVLSTIAIIGGGVLACNRKARQAVYNAIPSLEQATWKSMVILSDIKYAVSPCVRVVKNAINSCIYGDPIDQLVLFNNNSGMARFVNTKNIDIDKEILTSPKMLLYGHAIQEPLIHDMLIVKMQRLRAFPLEKPLYIASNVKLMAANIRLLENGQHWVSYPLALKQRFTSNSFSTIIHDYAIEGNILLDKTFVNYWLQQYHGIALLKDQSYDVNFLDSDMNPVKIVPGQCIVLTENNYVIKNDDEIGISDSDDDSAVICEAPSEL